MAWRLCEPPSAMVTEKAAEVTPDVVARFAVAYVAPSSVRVILPVGAAAPAAGEPTVMPTVTGKAVPAAGVVVDGVMVGVVALGWMLTVTAVDCAETFPAGLAAATVYE